VVSFSIRASFAGAPPVFGAAYQVHKIAAKGVSIADLNGDGRGELLTHTAIYSLDGSGTLNAYATIGAPCETRPLAVDLTSDGRPDLVCAGGGAVRTLLAVPSGVFAPGVTGPSIQQYGPMAGGDFDEDGRADVAVVNGSETLLLFGNGSGGFRETRSIAGGLNGRAAVSADFNRDGHLDLAVASYGSGTGGSYVGLHLGIGDGTFQPRISIPASRAASDIHTGDLNGDGWTDILLQCDPFPALLINRGDGTFLDAREIREGPARCGNFGGDAADDIVVAPAIGYGRDPDISVLVGGVERRIRGPGLVRGMDAGDLSGDGIADVVITSEEWVFIYLGIGNGMIGSPDYHLTGFDGGYYSDFADFNMDPYVDVVTVASRDLRVAYGNSSGFSFAWTGSAPLSDNAYQVRDGDFTADGFTDFAVLEQRECGYHCYRSFIQVWRFTGTSFYSLREIEFNSSPFEAADFTGDGVDDIVGFPLDDASGYAVLTVYPGASGPTFGAPIRSLERASSYYGPMAVGDVNGDSFVDLALNNGIHLGTGDGHFGALIPFGPTYRSFDYVALADLDGDGQDELIGAGGTYVEIRDGPGDGTLPRVTPLTSAFGGPIAVGDITGDGVPEIAVGSPVTTLFMRQQSGAWMPERQYGGMAGAITFSDVDGDGYRDLLSVGAWARNLWVAGDRTPPVVRVESPDEGGSFEVGAPMTIRWSSSDSSGITGVDLILGVGRDPGTAIRARIASGLPAVGSLEWTPELAHRGSGWIRAVARDPFGNEAFDACNQAIDIVIPNVTVTVDSLRAAVMPKGIRVSWGLRPAAQITSVVVFRTEGDPAGPPSEVAESRLALDRYDDRYVTPGVPYTYTLEAHTPSTVQMAGSVTITFPDTTSSPPPDPPTPAHPFALSAGPSPFAMQTGIAFELPGPTSVRLSVFDVRGREMSVLVNEARVGGKYSESFSSSAAVSPGIYFIRLATQFGTRTRRVVLLP